MGSAAIDVVGEVDDETQPEIHGPKKIIGTALFAIEAKRNLKYSRSVMMRFSATIYP